MAKDNTRCFRKESPPSCKIYEQIVTLNQLEAYYHLKAEINLLSNDIQIRHINCIIDHLKGLFHPAFLARVVSWFPFVVAIFMGHENGGKQRLAKRRHVQGMLDETDPLIDVF